MTLKNPLVNRAPNSIFIEYFSQFLYIFVGLYAAFNHSLWRDEMQGWLVAWKSHSIYSLWQNNAPSGHPILWSGLIYLVKNLTGTPLSMQLLHWFLGSIALLCFWRWNPMQTWIKVLFTFGYYPFWEYFFVCRHYVLAELIAFIFCSCFPFRRKSYLPAAICIGLLTNSHAFSWSLAFGFLVILILEWCFVPTQRLVYLKNKYWLIDFILSASILVLLISFAGFSLLQARDAVELSPSLDLRHFLRVVGRIFGGYLLIIPNSKSWFDLSLCAFITFGILASTLAFLRRSWLATTFLLSGFSFLFLFNFYVYLGVGSRHYGYYFLILICSIWLALHPSEKTEPISFYRIRFNSFSFTNNLDFLSSIFPYVLVFCLTVQMIAGVHRTIYDFYVPYSAGEETAAYITSKGWSDSPLFGTRDVELTTVSGYLDRDIYYPELKRKGSYTQWKNRVSLERKDTFKHIKIFFENQPRVKRVLLILSRGSAFRSMESGDVLIKDGIRIIADKKFEHSWVKPERYYLYWAEIQAQEITEPR